MNVNLAAPDFPDSFYKPHIDWRSHRKYALIVSACSMADRVEQMVRSGHKPNETDANSILDGARVAAVPRERELDQGLEKTSFTFSIEKEPLTEIEQKQDYQSRDARLSRRRRHAHSRVRGMRPRGAKTRGRAFPGQTILDRLVGFIAELLSSIDRTVFRGLQRNGSREAAEDLDPPPVSQSTNALPVKSRKKRRRRRH